MRCDLIVSVFAFAFDLIVNAIARPPRLLVARKALLTHMRGLGRGPCIPTLGWVDPTGSLGIYPKWVTTSRQGEGGRGIGRGEGEGATCINLDLAPGCLK